MTIITRSLSGLRLVAVGAVLAVQPIAAQAEQFINVLTGGTSGVYYPIGFLILQYCYLILGF